MEITNSKKGFAMLWFDRLGKGEGGDAFASRMAVAALYYKEKYGQFPKILYLRPTDAAGLATVAGMEVKTAPLPPKHMVLAGSPVDFRSDQLLDIA